LEQEEQQINQEIIGKQVQQDLFENEGQAVA